MLRRNDFSSGDSFLRQIIGFLHQTVFLQLFHSVQECLVGCSALRAVALMGALAVVELQVTVQVGLELVEAFVEGLAEGDREKLLLQGAVGAPAGEVVTYGGGVASTLYFSSSGGKTASAADVFGVPTPYLVSRPDPWDKASPYHRWGPVLIGARTVQAKLGLEARVLDAAGVPTPSGRLRALTLPTTEGSETVPSGPLRPRLGAR